MLYKNGGASYLQVLTSETNHFSADLSSANLVDACASFGFSLGKPDARVNDDP
jgi:hypothetical protein